MLCYMFDNLSHKCNNGDSLFIALINYNGISISEEINLNKSIKDSVSFCLRWYHTI